MTNTTVPSQWESVLNGLKFADPQLQSLLLQTTVITEFVHDYKRFILWTTLITFIYLIYYLSFHVRRPHLVYVRTPLNQLITHHFHRLHRAYWPTPYLTHEICQAAVGSFVRLDPHIKRDPHFEREIRTMADGERLALDWLHAPDMTPTTPIVFTCHGLAGHTDELNMQYLALGVRQAGFRFAIFNRRGCALDMKLTKDFLYMWGCTKDMREMLAHIKERFPEAPLLGVGYSAGSNLLTKYLGETGSDSLIDAAISVANAYDVQQCSEYLARKPFHSFVMVNILKNMLARNEDIFRKLELRLEAEEAADTKHGAGEKLSLVEEAVTSDSRSTTPDQSPVSPSDESSVPKMRRRLSLDRVKRVKSVLEWDQHFSLLTHTQFSNLEEFYAAQSTTKEMIHNIQVPLFNLHALDDPIIPDAIIPYDALHTNDHIMMATTVRGGHLGYTEGWFPFASATWMEKFTIEYFEVLMRPEIWSQIKQARLESKLKASLKKQQQESIESAEEVMEEKDADVMAIVNGRSNSLASSQAPTLILSQTTSTGSLLVPPSSSLYESDDDNLTPTQPIHSPVSSQSSTQVHFHPSQSQSSTTTNTQSQPQPRSTPSLLPIPSFLAPIVSNLPDLSFPDFTLTESSVDEPLPSPELEDCVPDTPEPHQDHHPSGDEGPERDSMELLEDDSSSIGTAATAAFLAGSTTGAGLTTEMEFELTPSTQPSINAATSTPAPTNGDVKSADPILTSVTESPQKRRKVNAANDHLPVEASTTATSTAISSNLTGPQTPSKRKLRK